MRDSIFPRQHSIAASVGAAVSSVTGRPPIEIRAWPRPPTLASEGDLLGAYPMKLFKFAVALAATAFVLSGTAHASIQSLDQRVTAALESDPYLYSEHITVTSKDGVVTLHGSVGDEWDLRKAIKISSQVEGVKDVVDDLQIWQFGIRGR